MLFFSKYEKWYWALINRALYRKVPPLTGENHHIFPQCVYGKNYFTVKLTYREHYIAHLLLAKIQGKNHPKLWLAILRMNKPGVYNSKVYELARKKVSEWRSIKNKEEFDYSSILPKLHKKNSELQNRPWKNFNVKQENLQFWKKADIVWDIYVNKKYPYRRMYSYICDQISLPVKKLKILRNIIRLIDSGWNPQKDEEWLLLCQN